MSADFGPVWLEHLVRLTVAPWGVGPDDRLRAQVVATLHLVNLGSSMLATTFALLNPLLLAGQFVELGIALAVWNLAGYLVARTRWFQVAAVTLVASLPVGVIAMVREINYASVFFIACAWLAIGIGVSGFLFRLRATALVLVFYLLVPVYLAPQIGVPTIDIIGLEIFLVASALVVILHNWVIRASERRVAAQKVTMERSEQQSQRLQAIGQLAGGVAHDFNNLLLGIGGTAELARMRLRDGDVDLEDDLREIVKTTERAAELTRQLLAFGTRQVLNLVPMNVNEVAEELSVLIRRVIGEHIELRLKLAEGLLTVRADRHQIEQVIMNLVLNARDAMPDGGTVTVETATVTIGQKHVEDRPEVEPGQYVQLSVTDDGGGISAEVRQHLFEPFFTTKERGTGLGLATVYGIVKQHRGHISVYSTTEMGTTFKVYIPIAASEIVETPEPRGVETIVGGNERLLVVEDEDAPRRALVASLRRLGYQVIEAEDGQQALEHVTSSDRDIDLLLTDVVMPQMSGRELSERIKEHQPGVPVIFMSGYTEDTVVQRGVLNGEVDFLQKPFSLETLSNTIRAALDKR